MSACVRFACVRAFFIFIIIYILLFYLSSTIYTFPLFHGRKATQRSVDCGKVVKLSR